MNNPSQILKKKTLYILDQLDHFLDYVILYKRTASIGKEKNIYEIRPSDMELKELKNQEDLYLVEKFLQSKGINFEIVFDLVNDSPVAYLGEEGLVFATITGLPTDVKEKITTLKETFLSSETQDEALGIILDGKTGSLLLGNKCAIFDKISLEYYLLKKLVETQEAIFWTKVMNDFEGVDYDILLNNVKEKLAKKRLGDARDRINSKTRNKLLIKQGLITRKKNYYSLLKKVTEK